jgi:hypothetical protein
MSFQISKASVETFYCLWWWDEFQHSLTLKITLSRGSNSHRCITKIATCWVATWLTGWYFLIYTFPIKIIPDALVPLQPMPSILLLVTGYASCALPMIYTSIELEISYSHALGSWNKQTLKLTCMTLIQSSK